MHGAANLKKEFPTAMHAQCKHSEEKGKFCFLNFDTVFLTAVRMRKLRKVHCSPPLVDEDNSMVFTPHSVPFPATHDLRSLVAGNGTS